MAKATDEAAESGAGGDTKNAMDEVRHEASAKVDEVKHEVKQGVRDVREAAEGRAEEWRSSMGGRVDRLGRALRAAADTLREDGEESMADMAGDAAHQVERVSGYFEDESPRAMLDDFEELGRRNPGAFVGSMFALGLVTGRFLRASRPDGGEGRLPHSGPDTRALGQPEHPETIVRPQPSSYPQHDAHAPEPGHPGRPI